MLGLNITYRKIKQVNFVLSMINFASTEKLGKKPSSRWFARIHIRAEGISYFREKSS